MAFKSAKDYVNDKYKGVFVLPNDGDSAEVIFLYQSEDDALVCDAHYIKSDETSGYVQCLGRGCPACSKGLRIQTKLFIPLYNIATQEILFWDRNIRFQSQLQQDVFSKYPNPSEYVFRITRHGAAGDVNTTYSIVAIAKNTLATFAEICATNRISFPDHFNTICPEISAPDMTDRLNSYNTGSDSGTGAADALPNYRVTPRGSSAPSAVNGSSIPEPPDLPDAPEPSASVTESAPPFEMENTDGDASEGLDEDPDF